MTSSRFRRDGRHPVLDGDFPDGDRDITEALAAAAPAGWDGTTITFSGASGAGLPDGGVFRETDPAVQSRLAIATAGREAGGRESIARAELPAPAPAPATFPALPPAPAQRQPAAPAGGRFHPGGERPAIGDALASDARHGPDAAGRSVRVRKEGRAWAGKYGVPPCGHCGKAFDGEDPGLPCWERPIERLRYLAYAAGWTYDSRSVWTCPACQDSPAWQSLHRTLDIPGGPPAAAALAVDVMLASHDYPDILKAYDRKAAGIMAELGGTFEPARWTAGPRHRRHQTGAR